MCDEKLVLKLSESFKRELELLNSMVSKDEDVGEIATQSNDPYLSKQELNLVVHGPLSEEFYVVNCPFVWSEYVSRENMESFITTVKEHKELRDGDWRTFCFNLYFGFLYARLGKLSDAFKQVEMCEEHLSKSADDEFYKQILDGLNHGIQATKAHLNFLKGDAETADEIISGVVPLKKLSNPSKAALIAFNAEVMQEFGPNLKEMALELMKVAVKLDPDDFGSRRGAWYYTAGKFSAQLRRMKHRAGMPSREELQLLERAIKINPYPVNLATLAESYREACASAAFSNTAQVSSEVSFKMNSEAKQLYRRAFELDDQSSSTLRRCGNGLMKLPIPHKDLPLAKQCLEKAISVDPKCAAAYQALGTMEEKFFKNLNGALNNFRLSYENGNPVSGGFIVQVHMKMDRNYNPIEDLDKFISDIQDQTRFKCRPDLRAEFIIIKGEYLFFVRNDLLTAAEVWMEAITLAPKSENVMNHVCRVLHGRHIKKPYLKCIAGRTVFNLYECLKYEIRNVIGTPKYSEEDEELLKELLKLCENNSVK